MSLSARLAARSANTPPSPYAPPPSVAAKKAEAARRRAAVLGRAATTAQLERLAELLPVADVQVTHFRWYSPGRLARAILRDAKTIGRMRRSLQKPYPVLPGGGATIVEITSGEIRIEGKAECSDADNYCRRRGIEIAFGRAMAALEAQAASPVGLAFADRVE